MRRFSLVLIGTTAATLLLAACQKQPEPATDAATAPAPAATAEPAPAADTATIAAIDTKALPGEFSGTLPCASCPGIDTRLQLAPDGTFKLDERYQDQADGDFSLSGTWTVEGEPAEGERLRLDPDSKSDDDRVYRLVSVDELRLLDTEGKDIESALDYGLRRAPAADAPVAE
ncbi:copper resistance protein NlpE [Marilutibacter chinensis]|uniref:Copper resistance protein NlpE n=1 Tax=Marilutibacter chinensis TaxID=2912247 RepID=A0ABS9HWA0_9GAMM|nr:copper resistance protein NlpE [Lysobacter chinensis]MCF7223186.1 copper resistance protein NlpE [Lysobacter chinensis]